MGNVSDKGFSEYQNTFYVQYFSFSDNRAVYERTWKNVVRAGQSKNEI